MLRKKQVNEFNKTLFLYNFTLKSLCEVRGPKPQTLIGLIFIYFNF